MAKNRAITTISIDATSIKFLTALQGHVEQFGSVQLPLGLIIEGLVTDTAELGRILDLLIREHDLGREEIIVGIDAIRSIPRILTLPNVQSNLLEQTIQRTARKEMPVSVDTLYLSWQELPAGADEKRIYVVGVPRDSVDSHVAALQNASIKPYLMDLRPLALVRAIGQKDAVILSLEPRVLDIILVANWIPIIVRTFDVDASVRSIEDRVQLLSSETGQTIRYYNDSHREHVLGVETPLYFTGNLAQSPGLVDALVNEMNRPVSLPESPMPCPAEMPVPVYMTNIGLALKKRV